MTDTSTSASDRGDPAEYEMVVIGGGAAGLSAARTARWEGASVALVSDAPLGGDCTFTGCVPSKSLIEAARSGLGFAAALDHVASVIATIAATENADVLRHQGVDVIKGRAIFRSAKLVDVAIEGGGTRTLRGQHVMVATGSTPSLPPIPGLAETPFRTNESFFERRAQPESLVVLGGGPIGCELGEALARFGTRVTILEYGDRLLGRYEPDAAALVHAAMIERGIEVRTTAHATSVAHDGQAFSIVVDGEHIVADELLVATGRAPNTAGLNLEVAGIDVDHRGFITVDDYLRTSAQDVYAIGDANGRQMLSHAADEMGRVATWTALRAGRRYRYRPDRIPHAVFTTPEVAAIGVVEAASPRSARVAEMPMSLNDRAQAASKPAGFVRIISRPGRLSRHRAGGHVVGATIVGERAGELINEVALTMRGSGYPVRLAQTVRAYPSWSTIVQKTAALFFFDYDGHSTRPPTRT